MKLRFWLALLSLVVLCAEVVLDPSTSFVRAQPQAAHQIQTDAPDWTTPAATHVASPAAFEVFEIFLRAEPLPQMAVRAYRAPSRRVFHRPPIA